MCRAPSAVTLYADSADDNHAAVRKEDMSEMNKCESLKVLPWPTEMTGISRRCADRPSAAMRARYRSDKAFWGVPAEKELLGEPELRALPRMEAEGDARMAVRSSRPSSCRILRMTASQSFLQNTCCTCHCATRRPTARMIKRSSPQCSSCPKDLQHKAWRNLLQHACESGRRRRRYDWRTLLETAAVLMPM